MPTEIAEVKMLVTVLPQNLERPILPQQGVVVAGRGFMDAAKSIGVELHLCPDEITSGYRMGLASLDDYHRFKDSMIEKSREVYDAAALILRKYGAAQRG